MKRVILPVSTIAAFALSASTIAAPAATPLSTQVRNLNAQTQQLKREVRQMKADLRHRDSHEKSYHATTHGATAVHKGGSPFGNYVTISTSPFLGKKTAYDAANLLYMTSSMNEDLTLLKEKQQIETLHNGTILHPVVQLSGGVEGQLYSTGGFGTAATEGVSLSTAELDMNIIASSWASGFMSLAYSGAPISSGNRAPNSRIYLKRGFATIGNLNACPVYASIGLMYVPFGRYSSGMLSTPLTLSLGRIRSEAALLGFTLNNGLFGSVYGFSGSQTSGGSSLFKQGGVNVGFKHGINDNAGKMTIGAGWVSNIADAQGQQLTGRAAPFGGFAAGGALGSNNLAHRVAAIDFHGKVAYGPATLIGEYLGATRSYATSDMTFGGTGAEPKAMHAEMDYVLPWFEKKRGTSVGLAYGHTWQALALNLPQNSYSAFVNTSFWRNTVETIEYRHDADYSTGATASGSGSAVFTGTGRTRNSVIGQVGVYF